MTIEPPEASPGHARRWLLLAALAVLVLLLAAACGGGDEDADPTATPGGDPTATPTPDDGTPVPDDLLSGVFESGFEHSALYPDRQCADADAERYWLSWTAESRFDERIEDLTGVPPFAGSGVIAFRVTVRGELSDVGEYGHLGQYPRELVVSEVVAAEVATGCDGGEADGGGGSEPANASPPPVSASAGGAGIALGIGSYCWSVPGGPGLCADAIGHITQADPLPLTRGAVVAFASDLELTTTTVEQAQIFPASKQLGSGPDWLAWGHDGEPTPIGLVDASMGVATTIDVDPGRYVVTLFVRAPEGDVAYGLLIDVADEPLDASGGGIALGEAAELAPGETVAIAGEGATLGFAGVGQDSRCARDVVCVWAGEARLAFELDGGGEPTLRGVAVPPGGSASVALGAYRLTVLDLSPEATSAGPIAPSAYRATVVLERLPPLPAATGVQGYVSVGPQCPVQRADQPCPDASLEATLVLQDAGGNEVARGTSGADGLYRIAAPPGSYTLAPQPIGVSPLPSAGPLEVTIGAGGWITVDVPYDSGIR